MASRSAKRTRQPRFTEVHVPRRLLQLFGAAAIILIPWTMWLSYSLPTDHLDRRWDVAWSGFDIGLIISLAFTAYFGLRKSGWMIVSASTTGAFLIVDAWFDCLTAGRGFEYLSSIISACIELPLAIFAFWLAYRAGTFFFRKH